MSRTHGHVLGTRLDVTTYDGAFAKMLEMARGDSTCAVAAANTHLVVEAAYDPSFAEVLRGFDLVVPDGMPLVWALQLDGHLIDDRVYGPYLMRDVLQNSPPDVSHFFFGSTPECLASLEARAKGLNPSIVIAGSLSPPFGKWVPEMEADMIAQINAAKPDFVWVALGGVRQETWIAQHREHFQRGVLVAIGDGFPLVAGLRGYAPEWAQRAGLTWLFRLFQEPRRLAGRYLRYNSRFVFAFLRERLKLSHGR